MADLDSATLLIRWFRAGVAAADPRQAARRAVGDTADLAPSTWVIALGKGAHAMAEGAVEGLHERGIRVRGGLVVADTRQPGSGHRLDAVEGDHPVPDVGSFAAADRLGGILASCSPPDDALVLVSGGATSLVAAPVEGVTTADLRALFSMLLASGADIELMNALRKRVLRWGAGRLATALAARRVHCLIASDVVSNNTAFIASGPCVPDPLLAREVIDRASGAGLRHSLPPSVSRYLDAVAHGDIAETPKPDHPRFPTTSARIVLDRQQAVAGASVAATRDGADVVVGKEPVTGEAAAVGEFVAARALEVVRRASAGIRCLLFSGEATVRLGPAAGVGGRCLELALACAGVLARSGAQAMDITVLAAGTDGRDGPTDAAGAVVDGKTWSSIRQRGIDPASALASHDSYPALDSAGALVRTGPTGTNVNDLVMALVPARPD